LRFQWQVTLQQHKRLTSLQVQQKLTFLLSYNTEGDGDVIFRVSDPAENCDNGCWLTKSDPGFGANLSMLLAAYQAKTTVKIHGDPAIRWPLSNVKYCKLYGIQY
jgi:hypothetical protein